MPRAGSVSARACIWTAMAAAALLAVVHGDPANAEKPKGPPNALQGFSQNRDQPVKIQAASLEVREKDKVATFSGDVHVFSGDTELRCKSLLVFYEEETSGGRGEDKSGSRTMK